MRFKKTLLIGVGSILMFTMGGVGTASADSTSSTHKSTRIAVGAGAQSVNLGGSRCAGCHRAHTAKAEYLLKQAQPGLCYTCHNASGSFLDVVDGTDPQASGGALRGGGFAYSLINGAGGTMTVTGVDPVSGRDIKTAESLPGTRAPVTSRHQIDGTTAGIMWGNGAISDTIADPLSAGKTGVTLECGSCHDPHGNGNYRILKPVPSDAATKAVTAKAEIPAVLDDPLTLTVNEAKPLVPAVIGVVGVVAPSVAIPDALGARVYTTADYWNVNDRTVPNVAGAGLPAEAILDDPATTTVNEAKSAVSDGYLQNVAAWCTTCHTRYLAGSGAWNTQNRGYTADPAGVNGKGTNTLGTGKVDATFTYRHRSESAGYTGKASPNCIQCHVSHGTSATMSGDSSTYTDPQGNVPVAGTGTAGAGSLNTVTGTISGGTAIGTSRLLRIDNRGTCKMCHNV